VRLLRSCTELLEWRRAQGTAPLHFVPTMGALHAGHRSLIEQACHQKTVEASPKVLVSVFVNPLQFGPTEDFERYPRNLQRDGELAEAAGADALFAPSIADLYPAGESELTSISPPQSLQAGLCGRHRPGHFNGVATVVVRLLGLIRPSHVLLGEKDWQQLTILRRVVRDLGLPVQVIGCPTLRDDDGLALSSRNRYLNPAQRQQAAALPRALHAAAAAGIQPQQTAAPLVARVEQQLEEAGLVVWLPPPTAAPAA
jgi:pantoate ligase/cytidylate kinase